MTASGDKQSDFSLYKSGIYCADVSFVNGTVLLTAKGQSGDAEDYLLPLAQLAAQEAELHGIDWDAANEIVTQEGAVFQRFDRIDGEHAGVAKTAWLWARRGEKMPVDLIVCEREVIGYCINGRGDSEMLIKNGYEVLTPLMLWQDAGLSPEAGRAAHKGTFFVPMRDGVRLATELWLPENLSAGEKIPTILVRTPYGRKTKANGDVRWLRFVQRGYALVVQDTRGRGESEGVWVPKIHELADGDDTLNWIAAQAWSDGGVGMIGGSYGGFVQWAAAASGNKHLKAIVSYVTVGSAFGDIPRTNGMIPSGVLTWTFMMAEQDQNPDAANRTDWEEVIKLRPIKDIPKMVLGKDIHFWNEWMSHPDYDDFWAQSDWVNMGEQIDVPSLLISGWYDDDSVGTSEAWSLLERHQRKHRRMILGPWHHRANTAREIHNIPFGNNAIRYDLDLIQQQWFDRFLKGCENGVDAKPQVEYYMVGENEWKSSDSWPPAETVYTPFYLHSPGAANTAAGDGMLSYEEPGDEKPDRYTFDPLDPAPYLIDMTENECSVPENYREVEERHDVLVFTSPPLEEDVAIAGEISAVLYAASSAKDTDWVVRLTDVDEAGNSIRLSDGMVRARYRHSYTQPELLEPGKVEAYEVKMTKVANVFKKGHRIRVSVMSGAKNLIFPNHNTGNDPASDTEMIVALQTVHHDKTYPSHIRLPILPMK
ncbi:CocE/NonD family hydrolase [Brevibacillus fluminis]|uniref:CocE/NonD family hydrolase n=1 Tax=Brevibacillus fluminis TaxID=511487 RepID=A0A3M8DG24_9BACL|nr:CocE/NonD family hydrolase [Brevibacillus fluminis]RNB87052.1 CocE/NonD family hydrolase [Brevibacillus fluminis]